MVQQAGSGLLDLKVMADRRKTEALTTNDGILRIHLTTSPKLSGSTTRQSILAEIIWHKSMNLKTKGKELTNSASICKNFFF